jgi:hypothetical protein
VAQFRFDNQTLKYSGNSRGEYNKETHISRKEFLFKKCLPNQIFLHLLNIYIFPGVKSTHNKSFFVGSYDFSSGKKLSTKMKKKSSQILLESRIIL